VAALLSSIMTLTHDVNLCQKCLDVEDKNRLKTSEKPYFKFQVEQKRKHKTFIKSDLSARS
jgi:hypothetical protein